MTTGVLLRKRAGLDPTDSLFLETGVTNNKDPLIREDRKLDQLWDRKFIRELMN